MVIIDKQVMLLLKVLFNHVAHFGEGDCAYNSAFNLALGDLCL